MKNYNFFFKVSTKEIDLNDFIDAETLDDIKSKTIRFRDIGKNQMKLKLKSSSIKTEGQKSYKQLTTIDNIIKNFCKSREEFIQFCNDYFKMVHKATYYAKHWKEHKILTTKQMLQRLPIACTQVKAGNVSENLNEIGQIIYFFYQANKITKKVYNNIMSSINV